MGHGTSSWPQLMQCWLHQQISFLLKSAVTQKKILRKLCVCRVSSNMCNLRIEVLYFILLACFGPLWAADSRVSLSCLPLEQRCDGSVEHDSSWVNQGVGIVSDIFMGAIEKAKSLNLQFLCQLDSCCAHWSFGTRQYYMIIKHGSAKFVSGYFEEETGFQLELADFHNSSLAIDISLRIPYLNWLVVWNIFYFSVYWE